MNKLKIILSSIFFWSLIFYNNIFDTLVLLDYLPSSIINGFGFSFSNNLEDTSLFYFLIKSAFSLVNLENYFFQFSLLIFIFLLVFFVYKSDYIESKFLFLLVYILNPFLYLRIITGQLQIAISYLLLPLLFYALFKYDLSSNKDVLKIALFYLICISFSPHFAIINFFLLVFFYFVKQMFSPNNYEYLIKLFFLIIFFSLFYYVNILFATGDSVNLVDEDHFSFFGSPINPDLNSVARIIGFWGFWREFAYYKSYDFFNLNLWILFILIIPIFIIFSKNYFIKKKHISTFFYLSYFATLIILYALNSPSIFIYIKDFVVNNFLFQAFRDNTKLVSVLSLSTAYFVSIKKTNLSKNTFLLFKISVLTILIANAFPIIGLHNQINHVEIPVEYQDVDILLDYYNSTNTLYLPWELYLTYNWSVNGSPDGRTVNVARKLFSNNVYTGPGLWGLKTNFTYSIANCVSSNSSSCLIKNNVSGVIVDDCAYYVHNNYSWLEKNYHLEYESKCLNFYLN